MLHNLSFISEIFEAILERHKIDDESYKIIQDHSIRSSIGYNRID